MAADVESGNADMELILLLGSGTNKGRAAEAEEGCGCCWGSRRSFGIFAECCCSDSCWFLHCFRWKSMERDRDRESGVLLVAFGLVGLLVAMLRESLKKLLQRLLWVLLYLWQIPQREREGSDTKACKVCLRPVEKPRALEQKTVRQDS